MGSVLVGLLTTLSSALSAVQAVTTSNRTMDNTDSSFTLGSLPFATGDGNQKIRGTHPLASVASCLWLSPSRDSGLLLDRVSDCRSRRYLTPEVDQSITSEHMFPDNNLILTGFDGDSVRRPSGGWWQRNSGVSSSTPISSSRNVMARSKRSSIVRGNLLSGTSSGRWQRNLAGEGASCIRHRRPNAPRSGEPEGAERERSNLLPGGVTPEEDHHARVAGDSSRVYRPLLEVADPKQRIIELLDERGPDYARFTQLATDQLEPECRRTGAG